MGVLLRLLEHLLCCFGHHVQPVLWRAVTFRQDPCSATMYHLRWCLSKHCWLLQEARNIWRTMQLCVWIGELGEGVSTESIGSICVWCTSSSLFGAPTSAVICGGWYSHGYTRHLCCTGHSAALLGRLMMCTSFYINHYNLWHALGLAIVLRAGKKATLYSLHHKKMKHYRACQDGEDSVKIWCNKTDKKG